MTVQLIQGWNDKNLGDYIDLPDHIAGELIRREIAVTTDKFEFRIDDNFWKNKDLQWNLKNENT